ncbi:MAG: Verru_Chthon cassette protein D [Verrucomicrobiota bacterium]
MKRIKFTKTKGFSLAEMLVVLTIMGLLMALAAPNLFSLMGANTLSSEGVSIKNQLSYAQQLALSTNTDVEVRFFRWQDPSAPIGFESFSAYQLYSYNSKGEMVPKSSFFRIPPPVIVSEVLSTLLDVNFGGGTIEESKYGYDSPRFGEAPAPRGSGSNTDVPYVAFRFRPDGSTDLPNRASEGTAELEGEPWYITLVEGEADIENSAPRNYYCIQVNPFNGSISQFRP